jgi:anaerobic ribonucleoside-triphosphate reductase activating protein
MQMARFFSPVHTLGPGSRVALWTQGCGKKCPECTAPELQPRRKELNIPESVLARMITDAARRNDCSGLTISGGDPLEQPEALLSLLTLVRGTFEDILVYTGYTMEEIRAGAAGEEGAQCLKYIDVLIDGRYVPSLNDPSCTLRGSSNQKIWYLTQGMEERYAPYLSAGRKVENFIHQDHVVTVGIQDREEE